jgi:molecular chaperone GrpE
VKKRRNDSAQHRARVANEPERVSVTAGEAGAVDSDPVQGSANETPTENQTADANEASRPEAPELELVEKQRDEFRDLLLRQTAEFDNFRKRTERERQMLEETAAENVIHDLLPLVDDLERALSADPGEGTEAYRRGVELIHRRLLDILRRRGVEAVQALGAEFDPHVHQAVSYEHAPDKNEGEIVEEFRRGYKLGDRLLRPSMVKVAKG